MIGFAPAGKPGGGLIRRQQLEAWKAAQPKQLSLFELKDDCRPAAERTAAGRYQEPTLFAVMPPRRESAG